MPIRNNLHPYGYAMPQQAGPLEANQLAAGWLDRQKARYNELAGPLTPMTEEQMFENALNWAPMGIGQIGRFSSGKYIGSPNIASPSKLGAWRKNLENLIGEGLEAKEWYENSGKAILKHVGGDVAKADKLIGQVAVYSQGQKVAQNMKDAMRALRQLERGEVPTVGRYPNQMAKKAQEVYGGNINTLGQKQTAFYENLMHGMDPAKFPEGPATIDMWIMKAGGYPLKAPSPQQYKFMESEVQELAKKTGLKPHQAQAAIWSAVKTRYELARSIVHKRATKKGLYIGQPGFDEFMEKHIDKAAKEIKPIEVKRALKGRIIDFSNILAERKSTYGQGGEIAEDQLRLWPSEVSGQGKGAKAETPNARIVEGGEIIRKPKLEPLIPYKGPGVGLGAMGQKYAGEYRGYQIYQQAGRYKVHLDNMRVAHSNNPDDLFETIDNFIRNQ